MELLAGFRIAINDDRNGTLGSGSPDDCGANALGSAGHEHDFVLKL
jgi:hypothetical protein